MQAVAIPTFETSDISVELSVRAISSSDAIYVMIFVYKPLEDEFERGRSSKEGDML